MARQFSRRNFVGAGVGTVAAGSIVMPFDLLAQAGASPKAAISARVDREFDSLDPAYRRGPAEGNVMRAVFQRLMTQKPNSTELELDAAAEVRQVSPTVIEFRLKSGQMFGEGYGEMTAEDVKFSFERIGLPPKDGARESSYRKDWLGLVGVELKSKYEGRITLEKPRANIFDVVIADGSGCIVSKKAVEKLGADYSTRPVGSGPYRVTAYDRQKGITLKRNLDYKGRRRHFEEIDLRVITDAKTTELALRAGEVDFAVLSPTAADPLRGLSGITVSDQPSMAYVWLGMNVEKGALADLRVRQAIRLGLDVDQMLLAGYNGKVPRLNTTIPPLIMGSWKDAPVYKRNVAEARKLLAAANPSNLRFKLTILNQQQYKNMALVVQALLAEIGVTIEVDAQEGGTYWNAGKGDAGKNLELYMSRFSGKHDPNFVLQWFLPAQVGDWNWSRWNSPEFEALYNSAASEMDVNKRRQMVLEMQQLMDRSSAFVWLTNEANTLAHRSWMKPAAIPGWIDWQYAEFSA